AWEGVKSASRALRWKFTRSASSPSSLSQGGHSPRGRNSWPKGGGRPSWSAPTAIRPYTRGNQPRKSRSSHWRATCIERCPRGSDRGPLEKDPPSGGHLPSGLPGWERKIPKPGGSGKLRKPGIPCIADRVVQAALKLVLEPIFETDFEPVSYGFRPLRRAHDAIAEIRQYGTRGYRWVPDADIEAAFDNLSHSALTDRVRARVKEK